MQCSNRVELHHRSRHLTDTSWYDDDPWQPDYIHTPTGKGCRIFGTAPGLTGYVLVLQDGSRLENIPPEELQDAEQLPLF